MIAQYDYKIFSRSLPKLTPFCEDVLTKAQAALAKGQLKPLVFKGFVEEIVRNCIDLRRGGPDQLDLFFDKLIDLPNTKETKDPRFSRVQGMVPYVPSNLYVLYLLRDRIPKTATFVDLGCGVGRVPIFMSMLLGVKTVGIEIQKQLAETGKDRVYQLGLKDRVSVVADDTRHARLSHGTDFFMYRPFVKGMSEFMIRRLERVALGKVKKDEGEIRIHTVDCSDQFERQPWLRAGSPMVDGLGPSAHRIRTFYSDF